MSIIKVGTPFSDKASAIFCRVLVLPLPVAPEITESSEFLIPLTFLLKKGKLSICNP
jgi:hypothetical protein